MATDKKSPFGLDANTIASIDWSLAIARIQDDIKSDFVYSPHLNYIYRHAGEDITSQVIADLKGGAFAPSLPINIEVPKSARIKTKLQRLGPPFSRQGSILLPKDRLLYQAIADVAATLIQKHTDESRSFSHKLAGAESPVMFMATRTCWSDFQKALSAHSKSSKNKYVLRTDIANCFGALNQHTLINKLQDAGLPSDLAARLEVMLIAFTGDRSSRGILQGLYPSDLFGNFYLNAADRFFADASLDSARYVDDIYAFVGSANAADTVMRDLILLLRDYDLSLNESKSLLMQVGNLITEEPDLEALFQAAVEEVSEQLDGESFGVDYGFQTDWDEVPPEPGVEELELAATIKLFEAIDVYTGQEENIERFCLPLFAKANSDHAILHVLENFRKRPAMAQIYCSYLVKFIEQEDVRNFLVTLLQDDTLMDWQTMWVMATLLSLPTSADDKIVKIALDIYKNGNRHEALRAAAAIFVGRFGDHIRRTALMNSYAAAGSPYVQSAIYFSSNWFPKVDKVNAKSMWGDQGPLNQLLTKAMANAKKT